jgi:hypothetical protein
VSTTTPEAPVEEERKLRSVEDMARDEAEAEEQEDDGTPQLILPGTGSKLSTNVGGQRPTESVFKMAAVSLPIAGGVQLDKDTELWVAVPVAIDDVNVGNRRKNREIASVVRTHKAIPIGQPVIMDGPPES